MLQNKTCLFTVIISVATSLLHVLPTMGQVTADPDLLAWWKFDDTLDDETGNNILTAAAGDAIYSPGSVGQALHIGGGDYFTVDNTANLLSTSGSIHLRFNTPSLTAENTLFARSGNSGSHHQQVLTRADTVWQEGGGSHVSTPDSDGIKNGDSDHVHVNTWHTYVSTSDGDTLRMWIDGNEIALTYNPHNRTAASFNNNGNWWQADDPNNSPGDAYKFAIGALAWQTPGNYIARAEGGTLIDDIAMWSRVLSDAEVASISGPLGVANLSGSPVYEPPVSTWTSPASGSWHDGQNWNKDVPNNSADEKDYTAVFSDSINSPRVVLTESDVTVRTVRFDHDETYAISGLGTINLESGSVAEGYNASLEVEQGEHQFQAPVKLHSPTDLSVSAVASLTFNGALDLNGNTLTKTGDGTVTINNRLLSGGGTVSGAVIGAAGTIGGDGTIRGDVDNSGATIAPGNSAGVLTIDGNFNNGASGTVSMEIEGTAGAGDAQGHDQLQVTGNSTLDGTLSVTSGAGYADPTARAARDNFTLIASAGGSSGAFATVNYNGAELTADFTGANGSTRSHQGNGLFRNVNYDGNNVSLTNLFALEGDADGDIDIDITDFNILASNFDDAGANAETNSWTTADFDADGDIDITDFNFLAANFADSGYGENTTGQVPEPTTWLLALIGLAGLVTYASGFRRRTKG